MGLVAWAAPVQAADPSGLPDNPGTGLPPGQMPMTGGGQIRTASAPAGAHLTYSGGKVLSNVQVTQVLYGSGTYQSEVSGTGALSIASFYTGVTNSAHFDWLSEYNTSINAVNGQPGTNQVIGRGSFAGQRTISPLAARNGSTITDASIQAELKAQITAGVLAMPNANTLLAVHFPVGKTITSGGSSSGVDFCAYHGTVAPAGSIPQFYYSVLPDFTTGGMASGCGSGTRYQNETSVSSHELIEAVTDPEVGLAGALNNPPIAWYDNTNGEIGDICNHQHATVVGGDGVTYTVQNEFSNVYNDCIATAPAATNDFSVAASPSAVTVAAGSSGTTSISTAVTSGSAQTVNLSATGGPAGATASFSPASVAAGASSTLTLATASSTPAGTYTVTITGTGTSATHTAAVSLTVTGGTAPAGVANGGFEAGNLSSWTPTGTESVTTSTPHGGAYADQGGAATATNGDSSITQTFTVPATYNQLSFWYKMSCPDRVTYDWATATLRDNTAGTTTTVLPRTCATNSAYVKVTATVTAGHSYTLTMTSHDDNFSSDPSFTKFDDVTLTAPAATNDFSLVANPTALTVTAGGSGTSTIATAVTSGSAQTVSLSATGLPTGATASFSPGSVTAGGSSTLTLATSSSTPAGTYTVTVTGTGTSATHGATIALTVSAPAPTNDFSIAASPTSATIVAGGTAATTVGTAVTSGAAQTVSLSATGVPTGAIAAFSPGSVTAGGSSNLTISTGSSTPPGTYVVTVTGTGSQVHSTSFSVTVNPVVVGGGVTNGGFEAGVFSGWTTSGTESITTSTPHSGTYADQAGATTKTNGDSSITQTFTVPTGATQLSFWYRMSCPDKVAYDWATATLKDNTANATTTVLPKTCATNAAYVKVTASVVAGHSYTLTLTSHDDNFASDPSYTRFDDVTLT
jgi:hypothetical protein